MDYQARLLQRLKQRQQQPARDRVKVERYSATDGGWVLKTDSGQETQLEALSNGAIALEQIATRKNAGFKVRPMVKSARPPISAIDDPKTPEFAALLKKTTNLTLGTERVQYWIVTAKKEYKIAEYDRNFKWEQEPIPGFLEYPVTPVTGRARLNLTHSYAQYPSDSFPQISRIVTLTAQVLSPDGLPVSVHAYLVGNYSEPPQNVGNSFLADADYESLSGGPSGSFFYLTNPPLFELSPDGELRTFNFSQSTPLTKFEFGSELATPVLLPPGLYKFKFTIRGRSITNQTQVLMDLVLQGIDLPEAAIELTYSKEDNLWHHALIARDSGFPRKAYALSRPTQGQTVTETTDPDLPELPQSWRAGVISWLESSEPDQPTCIDALKRDLFNDYHPGEPNKSTTVAKALIGDRLTSKGTVTYTDQTASDNAETQCLLSNPQTRSIKIPALLKGQLSNQRNQANAFEIIGIVIKPS